MIRTRSDNYLYWERALDKWAGSVILRLLTLFHRPHQPSAALSERNIRRILVIKLHGIGNILMMLPSLRALKERFPGSEIDLLTFESNAPLLGGIPDVSGVFYLKRRNILAVFFSILSLIPRLRGRRYDLVVDFEQFAYVTAIISWLTGSSRRIGFFNPTHSRHIAFTLPVAYLETGHMTRIFGRLVEAAGASISAANAPLLRLDASRRQEALSLLAGWGIGADEPVVVLHPGSSPNLILRRWPAERFAALGDLLSREMGARVVVGGDAAEIALADSVIGSMTRPAFSAAGRLSLLGYAALLARSGLVVSNDTAAVHLASALGTPVAGIYGPNTPALYGPAGTRNLAFYTPLPCSPCLKNVNRKTSLCTHAGCIEAITVEDVYRGIAQSGLGW